MAKGLRVIHTLVSISLIRVVFSNLLSKWQAEIIYTEERRKNLLFIESLIHVRPDGIINFIFP